MGLLEKNIFNAKMLLSIGAAFLFVVGLVILFDLVLMPIYTKHGESLEVPNTIAMRFEEAKELLEEKGLIAVKSGEKYDSVLPFGYIVEQNPREKRLVKKGRRVYLVISVGERDIEVPQLVGLSETNAIERLKSSGLRVGEIDYQYSDELRDVVIGQSNTPSSLLKASSTVDLVVSNGKPIGRARVPALLGKSLQSSERELKKAGLQLGEVKYELNEQLLPNTVIVQDIEAGTEVPHGTYISLVVSSFALPDEGLSP
jgi:serine/threonine-protein kinase